VHAGASLTETAAVPVVVVGAASDLGGRVLRALTELGVAAQGLVRRPGVVDGAVVADLADPESLTAAFVGATRLFLMSSPVRDQVVLETNAIEAAEAAGIERIVKVSNIPIAGLESGLHGNHRAIERRLALSPVASTVLQPSFFSTVMDRQRALIERGVVVLPFGSGRIAWVDPQDIADVAAAALARNIDGPLVVTGPEALDGDEVAARLGVRRLDPPLDEWRDAVVADGLDPWLADSTVELYRAVSADALAGVSPVVERVLGRPARQVFQPA
jgi:uncharacterized protein YbjT (DUF2867 family)